jgi:type VI secretion system protein ImpF
MAKIRSEQPLVPSVLDRLLDDEPELSREAPRSRNQILRDLKQSVRRDLEDLLNTRRRCGVIPPGLDGLEQSLAAYGLPEVTGVRFGSEEGRERFRELLETIIVRWEPRFKTVKVVLLDGPEQFDRAVRFRVDALLLADPAPEPVVFDSRVEPATGGFEVRGVA